MSISRTSSKVAELEELPTSSSAAADAVDSCARAAIDAASGQERTKRFLLSKEGLAIPNYARLKPWLYGMAEPSQTDIGCAVYTAAYLADEAVVRFLLSEGRTISSFNLSQSVNDAATAGADSIVSFLLSEGRSINRDQLSEAVYYAMLKDHVHVIRAFLAAGYSLTERQLGWALGFSVENEKEKCVDFFISLTSRLPSHICNDIFVKASQKGWKGCVAQMIEKFPIAEELRMKAIKETPCEEIRALLRTKA